MRITARRHQIGEQWEDRMQGDAMQGDARAEAEKTMDGSTRAGHQKQPQDRQGAHSGALQVQDSAEITRPPAYSSELPVRAGRRQCNSKKDAPCDKEAAERKPERPGKQNTASA